MRAVDVEPSYAELVEANRKYLVLVTQHHPELAHMVPAEKLIQQEAAKRVRIIKGRAPAAAPTNYIPPPRKPIEVRAAEVAERHDLLVQELIGPSCSRRYSEARGEFIVACRKLDIAYKRIGDFMSGRNFSTIIHHEKKYLATLRGAA
jgi:chromosomal replication initiation ATPase DnaA